MRIVEKVLHIVVWRVDAVHAVPVPVVEDRARAVRVAVVRRFAFDVPPGKAEEEEERKGAAAFEHRTGGRRAAAARVALLLLRVVV